MHDPWRIPRAQSVFPPVGTTGRRGRAISPRTAHPCFLRCFEPHPFTAEELTHHVLRPRCGGGAVSCASSRVFTHTNQFQSLCNWRQCLTDISEDCCTEGTSIVGMLTDRRWCRGPGSSMLSTQRDQGIGTALFSSSLFAVRGISPLKLEELHATCLLSKGAK